MKCREHVPHEALQRHVKCFWSLERTYGPGCPVETVTPDPFIELILNFGAPYRLVTASGVERELPSTVVMGLQRQPLELRCDGTVRLVAARFHAWGAIPFLSVDAVRTVAERGPFGPDWAALARRVAPAVKRGDDDAAVAALEEHLLQRLLAATVDADTLETAARLLHQRQGQFRIAELADACDRSQRQLERAFQGSVGVSPKTLARNVRFEVLRKRLMLEPDASLTELAHEFGYADQAHFTRDFKALAGRTPSEFAREMRALQSVFADHEHVVFLQSDAELAG